MISPNQFSLYSESFMNKLDGMRGIRIGGHKINNIRYVDNTLLMAVNEHDLQNLLNDFNVHSGQWSEN